MTEFVSTSEDPRGLTYGGGNWPDDRPITSKSVEGGGSFCVRSSYRSEHAASAHGFTSAGANLGGSFAVMVDRANGQAGEFAYTFHTNILLLSPVDVATLGRTHRGMTVCLSTSGGFFGALHTALAPSVPDQEAMSSAIRRTLAKS